MIGVVIVVVVVLDDEYELKDEKEESGPMSYNDGKPVLTLLLLLQLPRRGLLLIVKLVAVDVADVVAVSIILLLFVNVLLWRLALLLLPMTR